MFTKKNIISIILVSIIAIQIPVFADDLSDTKVSLTDVLGKLIQKYETRIKTLEAENAILKQEIITLKGTRVVVMTGTTVTTPVVSTGTTGAVSIAWMTSKTDIYNAVIKKVNTNLSTILSENNLPGYSVFGLFEFIEPNAFFLSLDDGNNPAWVTAFKTKILFTYDNNLNLTKIGLFDLDYSSQKYRTVYGSNPYTKAVRVKVLNPNYKGKLLDNTTTTSTGSTTSTTTKTATTTTTTEVTLAQIKAAYDKTKLLDAIKLSDTYILKDPNNLDVLRIRYRSYYIIGKYENSLAEIKKIETIQGSAFEKTIACDAAVIGKIAKKTDVSTYYSTICKKK